MSFHSDLAKELMNALNNDEVTEKGRGYLGMSGIGEKCLRKLQFDHYDTYNRTKTKRIKRLLDFGNNFEDWMYQHIADIGITVYAAQEELIGVAGHWKGHTDGKATAEYLGETHLFEGKTYNIQRFRKLKKVGVQESDPGYYAQCQEYMGHTKLNYTIFCAYCKDNSEYYIEFLEFDDDAFDDQQRKALHVITSDVLLDRIGNNTPNWFECKLCDAVKVCYSKEPVVKSCKNCYWSDVLEEGKWGCTHYGNEIVSPEPCDDYKIDPMFKEL